jgi:predicted SprT family Zn-dependent metalloprotease
MELSVAQNKAIELMHKHGLLELGWHFEFDNAKRRFGVCNYTDKKIGLSKHLTALNDEARIINTILHEIAHALVGHRHGHDRVWSAKAIEIGCDGKRCYDSKEVERPQGNYEAICPCCEHKHIKFKRPTRQSSCGRCGNGRFSMERLLVWNKSK